MVASKYNDDNNDNGPVRLDAWVAAKQPHLHPTRRKVLQAVADLCAGGLWTNSRDVRQVTGLSQQLMNRHLRGLENDGLVRLENPGPGLPLNALPTPMGLRILGQTDLTASPAPSQAPTAEPELPTDAVGELARQLYRRLEDHLLDLDRSQTEQLLRRVLADASAPLPAQPEPQPAPPAPAQAAVPPPATPVAPPEPQMQAPAAPPAPAPAESNILAQLEAELEGQLLTDEVEEELDLTPQTVQEPPPLSQAEITLEERLLETLRKEYRGRRWFERTREFSEIWDRARRRHLGLLGTFFSNFRPRWDYPEWEDFNLGRRQADARGASYDDWIKAQFDRVISAGGDDVMPEELNGDDAIRAYQSGLSTDQQQPQELGPPPFTVQTFDINDTAHVTYAESMLDQLSDLAASVYGEDPQGPISLAVEAVKRGNLPVAALDLRPEWKPRVLAILAQSQVPLQAPAYGAPQAPQAPQVQQAPQAPAATPMPKPGGRPPLII